MPRRFGVFVCVLALGAPISSARSDPPPAPPGSPPPVESGSGEATARAEARVKELEAEVQKVRRELERVLTASKEDPTTAAVRAAVTKLSDVERRLQEARDEVDRLRGDRGYRIDEAQKACVARAEELARARNTLGEAQAQRRSEAELAEAKARIAAAQQALRDAQAALVALPAPVEPRPRPDYFDRTLAQAAERADLLASGAKLAGEAAAAVEATGDPVQIGLFYERAAKLSEQADAAREALARTRTLIDAARPAPAPKPTEPAGGAGPTVPPLR